MAYLYFNNAVNTSLNTLGNWWQDDTYSTPAVALPNVGDDAILGFNAPLTEVHSGTVTADTIFIFANTYGGTFQGNIINNYTIYGGTFQGSFSNEGGTSWIVGGTFNGPVTNTTDCFIYGGTFNDDLTIGEGSTLSTIGGHPFALNGRFRIRAGNYLYAATADGIAAPSDVRAGVSNLGATGTLGGGTITIEVA